MGFLELHKKPLCRIRLAVLLHRPVRVPYGFRTQGDHGGTLRMDERRLEDIAPFLLYRPLQTGRTADTIGTEVLSPVHDTEIVLAENPILFEVLPPLQ